MKRWKQINPRGVCGYTLAKDRYSISEEEANWAGSSLENWFTSCEQNKFNNLLNLLIQWEGRGESQAKGEQGLLFLPIWVKVHYRRMCTQMLSWQPVSVWRVLRSFWSHQGKQRQFSQLVIARTRVYILSQTLCWREAHNPFLEPNWTLPRAFRHIEDRAFTYTYYPPHPSSLLPNRHTLWIQTWRHAYLQTLHRDRSEAAFYNSGPAGYHHFTELPVGQWEK